MPKYTIYQPITLKDVKCAAYIYKVQKRRYIFAQINN